MSDQQIPFSRLVEALREITSDKTEAVILITVTDDLISARAYGDPDLIEEALEDMVDGFDLGQPMKEAYAH